MAILTSSEESESGRPRQTLRVAAALVWLLAFLAVFFSLDLPNSGTPPVNRRDLWLELPVLLQNCFVQQPDAPPSGWRFFPQRFPAIGPALLILAGVLSIGRLLLRALRICRDERLEQLVLAYGLGMSATSLLTLGCGLLAQRVPGAMSAAVLGGALTVSFVVEVALWLRDRMVGRRGNPDSPVADAETAARSADRVNWLDVALRGQIPFGVLARLLAGTVIVLFLVAMTLGALLPSIDFDVKEYHLQGPKEWFEAGRISWLPHNVYTSFPFLTEMFALLGMVLSGDWFVGALTGKLVLMTFAPATGLAVFCAGRRWFDVRVAWAAALIHLTAPWTYRISIIAYAEGGLTFFLFATLFALLLTREASGCERRRLTLLTGLFAGSSMACKYPGVLSVVMPLGVSLLWCEWCRAGETSEGDSLNSETSINRVLKASVIYSIGVLLAVGPWLLKNAIETGNPVYPLLNSVFHGADWTPALDANWKAAHGPPHHQPFDLLVKLFDVTLKSDWLSPLFYGLAPLTLLVVRQRRLIGGLWLYIAFLFLSWWVLTHRIDRFWIPMIPIVSLLAGVGVWWTAERTWRYAAGGIVALCVLFNLGFISTALCGLNTWLGDYDEVRPIAESSAKTIAALNEMNLPPDAKVLCVGEAQVFDARFQLVYNTVFDISIFEQWCSASEPGVAPADQPMRLPEEIQKTLAEHGITHVLVNWEEILRYRTSYRYTDFVAPHRFDWLVQRGVLEPGRILTGVRPFGSFSDSRQPENSQQKQILKWGPELIVKQNAERFVIPSQLFTVKPKR
ncbi:phospholipid carrier-dependent glycosyltransferase [bacterium]|nr:phospholipid carrier-dependent glycosyltransferase [bacterium]